MLAVYQIILSLSHGVEISRTLSAMTLRNLDQNDPSTHLRVISIDVIATTERVEHLVDNIDATFSNMASNMINELVDIDAKLIKWLKQLPNDWAYKVISPVSLEKFPTETRVFQDQWAAANRNFQSSCRILLHWTLIDLIQNLIHHGDLPDGYEDLLTRSGVIIRECADDICTTVPYILRETCHKTIDYELDGTCVGGYSLMWPMHLVARSRYVPEDQGMWARDLLKEKIGKRLGIHAALVHVTDENAWLSPSVKPNMERALACCRQSYP